MFIKDGRAAEKTPPIKNINILMVAYDFSFCMHPLSQEKIYSKITTIQACTHSFNKTNENKDKCLHLLFGNRWTLSIREAGWDENCYILNE